MRGQTKPLPGAQIDWGHPLAQGLVGCWLNNEMAGARAGDIMGLRPLTLNSASWSNGQLKFSGSSPSNATYPFNFQFTTFPFAVTAGVILDGGSSGEANIFGQRFSGGGAAVQLYLILSNNKVEWVVRDTATAISVATSTRSVRRGDLTIISGVRNPGEIRLFMDGALTATQTKASGDVSGASDVRTIGSLGASNYLNGRIAFVYVHMGYTWADAEVTHLHSEPYAFIRTPTYRKFFTAGRGR